MATVLAGTFTLTFLNNGVADLSGRRKPTSNPSPSPSLAQQPRNPLHLLSVGSLAVGMRRRHGGPRLRCGTLAAAPLGRGVCPGIQRHRPGVGHRVNLFIPPVTHSRGNYSQGRRGWGVWGHREDKGTRHIPPRLGDAFVLSVEAMQGAQERPRSESMPHHRDTEPLGVGHYAHVCKGRVASEGACNIVGGTGRRHQRRRRRRAPAQCRCAGHARRSWRVPQPTSSRRQSPSFTLLHLS